MAYSNRNQGTTTLTNLKHDAEQNTTDCTDSVIKCKSPGKPSDRVWGRRCRCSETQSREGGPGSEGVQGWTCRLHKRAKTPRQVSDESATRANLTAKKQALSETQSACPSAWHTEPGGSRCRRTGGAPAWLTNGEPTAPEDEGPPQTTVQQKDAAPRQSFQPALTQNSLQTRKAETGTFMRKKGQIIHA